MSIHLSGGGGARRRVVLSCDVAGCPVQVEPPAAEEWRSDADARSWARGHAVGWTCDPVCQTDYCPAHAEFSVLVAGGAAAPRPTATVRDEAGNPLNRDETRRGCVPGSSMVVRRRGMRCSQPGRLWWQLDCSTSWP